MWLAPATIVDGDNAEFATLGAVGGRAHPSGYPAYVLYLRAMSWLPGATPAHVAALATCVLGAAAVLVLHAACRAWGARPAAASAACALYAAAPVVLRTHVEAEVFAGNAVVVAAVLWLAAAGGPLRGAGRGAALGLIAGLGLANHLTCALVAPVGLLGIARAIRERGAAAAGAAAAGFVVGLLPYLYLVFADGPASYGAVDGPRDVLGFVLREDYGGPGAFAPDGGAARPGANLIALAATLGRGWLWAPALLGLAMLGRRAARPATAAGAGDAGEPRAGWIALAASFVLAGPLLAARFNLEPVGLGAYIVQRFHLLPLLVLAIPVAAGFEWLAARAELPPRLRTPVAAHGLAVVGFVALTAPVLPRLAAQHSPAVARASAGTLGGLPAGAVVVVETDDTCHGLRYLQLAEGVRPDVAIVCWGFLPWPWYQARLAARGIPLRGEALAADARRLAARRPLLFQSRATAATAGLPATTPYGVLLRVVPPGAPPPSLAEVVDTNRALLAGFELDYPRPGTDDDWATVVHQRYAAWWVAIAKQLAAAGDREATASALGIARALFPPAFAEEAR